MKLQINIQEDTELRNFIKDQIKQQVLSIVRDDIKMVIRDEVRKKLLTNDQYIRNEIHNLLRSEEFIKQCIILSGGMNMWNDNWIVPIVQEYLNKKLNSLERNLENEIQKGIKNYVGSIINKLETKH